jgi:hypothetical protein
MALCLAGMVCDGAGAVNEDRAGYVGSPDDVHAAWVLDGVTGINAESLYGAGSDAAWLVDEIDREIRRLLHEEIPLPVLMSALVDHLVAASLPPPSEDYDPPACCLLLVRRQDDRWDAARIGDSSLLVSERSGLFFQYTEFPLRWLDRELKIRSGQARDAGLSQAEVVAKFRPMIMDSRQSRNREGGYGILEADPRCLDFVQYIAIEDPADILICTDGFYRLADTYEACDDEGLLKASAVQGPAALLERLRAIEAADPDCRRYARFKPRDDAAAVCLTGKNRL